MRQLSFFVDKLVYFAAYFSGWLVPLMVLLICFEVFMRYVVGQPPAIADEFSAYMLVALSFLGLAHTWKEGGHVRVTALVDRLPIRVSNWLRLISLLFAFGFSIVFSIQSFSYLSSSFQLGMRSGSWINTPLQVPQTTILIGFVLLCLLLVVEIAGQIRKIQSTHEES